MLINLINVNFNINNCFNTELFFIIKYSRGAFGNKSIYLLFTLSSSQIYVYKTVKIAILLLYSPFVEKASLSWSDAYFLDTFLLS